MIAALRDLTGRIQKADRSPAAHNLLAYPDSQLMVGQCTQGWQAKAANLGPLVDNAKRLAQALGRYDLAKVPRDDVPSAGPCARPLARNFSFLNSPYLDSSPCFSFA